MSLILFENSPPPPFGHLNDTLEIKIIFVVETTPLLDMYSERNEKLKAGDMVFVVGEICHYFCLVVYSLFVVLKYLCLLIYYTVVDGTWSLISADLLTRQSIFKSKALICGVGGELGKLLALRVCQTF